MHTGFGYREKRNRLSALRDRWIGLYAFRCPAVLEMRDFFLDKITFHKPMTAPEIAGKFGNHSLTKMRTRVFYTKRKPEKYRYSRNDENTPCYYIGGKIMVIDV